MEESATPVGGGTTTAAVSVGFSDQILLAASLAGFCVLAVTVYSILIARLKGGADDELMFGGGDGHLTEDERLARANVATLTRAQRRARAKIIMKEQRRAEVLPAAAQHHAHDGDNGEDDNNNGPENRVVLAAAAQQQQHQDEDDDDEGRPVLLLSRKERQKAAKAAEKEERRLFQDERQQQQKEAQSAAQQHKKERLAAEANRIEQEKRQQQAEKEAKEHEERAAWSVFLTAASSSMSDTTTNTTREAQSVQDFLKDCKSDRFICIDKIATSFGVPPKVVVDRIEELLQDGRVAGFFQDISRFVFVSDDELSKIAAIVSHQKGSVSLENIAAICQQVMIG